MTAPEDRSVQPPGKSEPATENEPGLDHDLPADAEKAESLPPELGGQKGPEPTRYGDWEKGGRCTDF